MRVAQAIGGGKPARALARLLAVALVATALPASAKLGDGLKVGPGRLRLGAEVEGRYDSYAVSVVPAGATAASSYGDVIAKPRLSAALTVPGATAKVNATLSLDWNQYLGLLVDDRHLSFFGAQLMGSVGINQGAPVSFEITEALARNDRSLNPLVPLGALNFKNDTGLRLRWRPGGGAIESTAGYTFSADRYTALVPGSDQTSPVSDYNSITNRVDFETRWRFLPKTGVTFNATAGYRAYTGGALNSNGLPVRALLGFGTLLSTRLTFNVKAGYDGIFFSGATPTLHNWAAMADLGLLLTETFQARVGFQHLSEPVGGKAAAYSDTRGYLDFRAQFNRVVISAGASVDSFTYAGIAEGNLTLGLNARGDYNVSDWLRFGLALGYSGRTVSGTTAASTTDTYNRAEISFVAATLF